MTGSFSEPERYVDSDHLVETPESLRDSDPESPPLDRGIEETDTYLAADRYGVTAEEQRHGEPLDLRLSEEEPDVGPEGATGPPDRPAGRIVEEDEGARSDVEKDAVALDVGHDGGDQTAEEAAMHVIEER